MFPNYLHGEIHNLFIGELKMKVQKTNQVRQQDVDENLNTYLHCVC